jgi:hypothetical protein
MTLALYFTDINPQFFLMNILYMSNIAQNQRLLNNFVYKDSDLEVIDTLYYRLTTDDGSSNNVSVEFTPFVEGTNVDQSELYSGISIRYMSEPDFSQASNDLIMFEGYRTGSLEIPSFATYPPLYNETVTIKSMDPNTNAINGFIQANAIYEDSGSSNVTEISIVNYNVSICNGIFSGAKIIGITFDNDGTLATVGGPTGTPKSRLVQIMGFK